ncbi:MAG: HpcH/HpaI aldolase/citrate lyase family protein [Clostridia bacterium]|nr:HpcH/HpaI aldolase/citrate lyase family protein [Clostridia bacterium]
MDITIAAKQEQELCKLEKAYSVGALLYTPAVYENMAEKIATHDFKSIAFCLEDSIADDALAEAEASLKKTLKEIKSKALAKLPMIFVRVRSPKHLKYIHSMLTDEIEIITGYILPKFDSTNAEAYKTLFLEINAGREKPLYFMPILESRLIIDKRTRDKELYTIKSILDSIAQYILNVRVGGNDFCNIFGVRRNERQTIYDVGVVCDILIDILNVFSCDYVVSGPVWEYFGKDRNGAWAQGLKRELELDRLNGFIGKTSIHPEQLPLIHESLMVDKNDYQDALHILNWDSMKLGVGASANQSRMNEVKCHLKWARKIYLLGKIYGVKE